jgi:putative PIN family toxin of toxin-antitoxin system
VKVLLDTNVLISAFVSRGTCAEVVRHVAAQHESFTSTAIIREFAEKLTRKFKVSPLALDRALATMLAGAVGVTPAADFPPTCRDHDDDRVLAAAIAADCDVLVTGDADLLVLGAVRGVRIITPAAFLDLLRASGGEDDRGAP